MLALSHAPGGRHQQREAEVSLGTCGGEGGQECDAREKENKRDGANAAEEHRGFSEDIGRVCAKHSRLRHSRDIEIVVADCHGCGDSEARTPREQLGINPLSAKDKHAILVFGPPQQLLPVPQHVVRVGLDDEMLREAFDDAGEDGASDEHAEFA